MFGCLNFKKSLLLLGRGCEEHFYEGDNSNKQSASVEPSTCLIVSKSFFLQSPDHLRSRVPQDPVLPAQRKAAVFLKISCWKPQAGRGRGKALCR
ncbi:Hypothetical predicted protein [Podarcis lilfordi]|uniref:Uncharacterized protein n=1 Tax=Podarcis lilfordi TaxID=74358 RepID=A0AA35PCP6_9SAUR|nr:Hypothetical predicted protein [Podarcis lilfordi]